MASPLQKGFPSAPESHASGPIRPRSSRLCRSNCSSADVANTSPVPSRPKSRSASHAHHHSRASSTRAWSMSCLVGHIRCGFGSRSPKKPHDFGPSVPSCCHTVGRGSWNCRGQFASTNSRTSHESFRLSNRSESSDHRYSRRTRRSLRFASRVRRRCCMPSAFTRHVVESHP